MTRITDILAGPRAAKGGTVARVLLIVLGIVLALFGMILLVAILSIAMDDDASILFLLPFTIAACVGGIYIIVMQIRGTHNANVSADMPPHGAPAAPPATGASAPSAGQPAAMQTAASDAQPAPRPEDPTEDVAHLVFRSTDLFATLRDLVRHEGTADSDKRHLADMLEAAGIMAWPDAPACGGGRLTRNTHYWIRQGVDGLTDEQYDILVSAEAALGVNQDLPEVRRLRIDDPKTLQAARTLMRDMSEQVILQGPLVEEGLRAAYNSSNKGASTGEWVVRAQVCNAAECARTPFRVVYDLRSNARAGLVVLSIEIPRPRCLAIFTSEASQQAGLARAYAFRLAVLLASQAFASSKEVRRVVVNAHEHDSAQTLVSFDLDRQILETMRSVATGAEIETGFPTDERIRARFVGDWFSPVEPFVPLDAPETRPFEANIIPELDERPASAAVQRCCGAQRICELGINENAARIAAWKQVLPQLGDSTEQAVFALKAARDAARDITVAEACNRTMQALVSGEADLEDLSGLAGLFIDGSTLDVAVSRAVRLLDDSEGHEDPATAAQLLESALAPIEDMGAYLDDETTVYRYFGSVSERIRHNLTIDEGGREIRLVPDAYFNAHSHASIALGMLGENERALAHADVCLRLAPTSTYATMRKVRVLEAQSRIYEAADLIVAALRHATTPRDAAICHYRLAYMEWKLGREDLAAACYVRSLTWETEMAEEAREELDDLISSIEGLERPSAEQADALLAREGIPLGCVRIDGERTLAAAVACMDDGAFISARPLMAVLFGMNSDDVVMGIYRSLSVPV